MVHNQFGKWFRFKLFCNVKLHKNRTVEMKKEENENRIRNEYKFKRVCNEVVYSTTCDKKRRIGKRCWGVFRFQTNRNRHFRTFK